MHWSWSIICYHWSCAKSRHLIKQAMFDFLLWLNVGVRLFFRCLLQDFIFFLYFFLKNTDNFINSLKSFLNFLMMRSTLIWGSSGNKNWHLFENFHFLSVFDVTEFKAFELYEFQVKFCLFQGPFSGIFINLTNFFYWRCIFLFFCFLPLYCIYWSEIQSLLKFFSLP